MGRADRPRTIASAWLATVALALTLVRGAPVAAAPDAGTVQRSARPAALSSSARPSVLIYYANETIATGPNRENFETIMRWLRAGGGRTSVRIAGELQEDLALFPDAVDRAVRDIDAGMASLPADSTLAGALVFTNALALSGRAELHRPGRPGPEKIPFRPAQHRTGPLTWSPLSLADSLKAALALAVSRFPPSRYDYVLITKSHGNDKLVLTPRLRLWASWTNQEEVVQFAEHPGTGRHFRRPGVKKAAYLDLLSEVARRNNVHFSLVYANACDSGFSAEEMQHAPADVGMVFTNVDHVAFDDIDFQAVLSEVRQGVSLSETLAALFLQHGVTLQSHEAARPPS